MVRWRVPGQGCEPHSRRPAAKPQRPSLRGAAAAVAGYAFSDRTTVMWLVRFTMRLTRPMARDIYRFAMGPPST